MRRMTRSWDGCLIGKETEERRYYESITGKWEPHKKGCTNMALSIVEKSLKEQGSQTDWFWIGNQPLTGCIGCGYCAKKGKCRYDDRVNEFLETIKKSTDLLLDRIIRILYF